MHPHWLAQTLSYLVAALGDAHARRGRQLGDARALAPGLLAVDQPPDPERPRTAAPAALDAVRADHPRRADRGRRSWCRENLDFLIGIYAFGAMLAFTIAHLSICRLRYSEPDRDRPYRVPLSVTHAAAASCRCRRCSARSSPPAGWVAVMVVHAAGALRRARLDGGRASRCTSSTAARMRPRCCAA